MRRKKTKRLRMFAGPNGSGKSTVFRSINRQFSIGHYVNADDIEVQFKTQGFINLYDFDLLVENQNLQDFIKSSSLVAKAQESKLAINLKIIDNIVVTDATKVHSYEAALLTAFLRHKFIEDNQSFSFETVMSHKSKCEILEDAKRENYQNYLYFICTKSADINVGRVENRVTKGGHPVPKDKIVERYHRSLGLLRDAIKHTHRTYIFDNSKETHKLILEIYQGKEITIHTKEIPVWVKQHILDKML